MSTSNVSEKLEDYTLRGTTANLLRDYLRREDYDARRIYEEILAVAQSEVRRAEKDLEKAKALEQLLMGYRNDYTI